MKTVGDLSYLDSTLLTFVFLDTVYRHARKYMILLFPETPMRCIGLPASWSSRQRPNGMLTGQHGYQPACSAPVADRKKGFTGAVNIPYSLGIKGVTSVKDLH